VYGDAPKLALNACSTGGRQVLPSAEYPADFDGIVAGARCELDAPARRRIASISGQQNDVDAIPRESISDATRRF
jgi:hypothetical protein